MSQAAELAPTPLVIGLVGGLVRGDPQADALARMAARSPVRAVQALFPAGRRALAAKAAAGGVDPALTPLDEGVAEAARAARAEGRSVWLTQMGDGPWAEALAGRLGLFEGVVAAADLDARFGAGGYDFIGADPPAGARNAVRVRPPGRAAAALRALRPHQWLKNLLVFVPALADHAFDARLLLSAVAFVAFSLVASSVYLLNDLVDLESDRRHARKRRRPMASGALPPAWGAAMILPLLVAAAALASLLPGRFALALAGYWGLTLAYSFRLKRLMIADVIVLACLYGARVAAGGAATGIALSTWLGALAIFLFLSLALVKRCAELHDRARRGDGDPAGRGYLLADLPALQAMAAASGYIAVLVFALYLSGPAVTRLYAHPHFMWLISVVMLYWISRVVLKTARGEMHDDPVIFAATDRVSLACAAFAAAAVAAATWL